MTLITFTDGQPVLRDGKVGTEQACCCGGENNGGGNCGIRLTLSCPGMEDIGVFGSQAGDCPGSCVGIGPADGQFLFSETEDTRTYVTLNAGIESPDGIVVFGAATFSVVQIAEDGSDGGYVGGCDIYPEDWGWDGETLPFENSTNRHVEYQPPYQQDCPDCTLTVEIFCFADNPLP